MFLFQMLIMFGLMFGQMLPIQMLVSAQTYRNELRHLPEKLRQERIQNTVSLTFQRIHSAIFQAATANRTNYQFSLYCIEPNVIQEVESIYQPNIDKYVLLPNGPFSDPILPKPRCENKYGYELYQKWQSLQVRIYNDGTEKRKRASRMIEEVNPMKLESTPSFYIQQFFQLFYRAFPDIRLDISSSRPSNGIFETECCPIYNASW